MPLTHRISNMALSIQNVFLQADALLILELLHVRKPFDQLQGHPELIVL